MPNDQSTPSSEAAAAQTEKQDEAEDQDEASIIHQMVSDQFREFADEAHEVEQQNSHPDEQR